MSFDTVAPHYRWMELVLAGNKLQRCRTAFLTEIPEAGSILILGEGHGRFLPECCRAFPEAKIICVDASKKMLAIAEKKTARAGANGKIEFVHADALDWTPRNSFDLIATHFFLDCFTPAQLEILIPKIASAAAPNSVWLIADFQAPHAGLRRIRARLILQTMYLFFRIVTRLPARRLTAPDEFLKQNGFSLRERRESEWGLLKSDFWERR
jgi:ubiquinone/menaquinone biosynthesis C-methylase UbiE